CSQAAPRLANHESSQKIALFSSEYWLPATSYVGKAENARACGLFSRDEVRCTPRRFDFEVRPSGIPTEEDMSNQERVSLLPRPQLLITESAEEFDAISEAIKRQVNPVDIIEEIYVSDITDLVWQIIRLRRCKAGIINAGYRAAMEQLFPELLRDWDDTAEPVMEEAKELAWKYFRSPEWKAKAAKLLNQYHLNDSVIEAIAVRNALSELERLDKMEASCELRYGKALRGIADYRESFAQRLRDAADRIIAGKPVLQLQDASGKPAA